MPAFRRVPVLLALSASSALASGVFACGTSAVGVEDCTRIEQARCDAGLNCGFVSDAEACKRFYRDQCLHGLAGESRPGGAAVDRCVTAIVESARCAEDEDARLLSDCSDAPATPAPGEALSAPCDVVRFPERTQECSFLTSTSDTSSGSAGSAGQGGAETSSAGVSGAMN